MFLFSTKGNGAQDGRDRSGGGDDSRARGGDAGRRASAGRSGALLAGSRREESGSAAEGDDARAPAGHPALPSHRPTAQLRRLQRNGQQPLKGQSIQL